MVFSDEAAIDRIGLGLLDRSLPKPEWTHAAHLAAAAWLLCRRPKFVPERDMPAIIRAYNEATGVPNSDTRGYHETITFASLRAVRAFLDARDTDEPLHLALNALIASPYGSKRWVLEHWSEGVIFTPEARRRWVEPDIKPLPF
ncbi:hypothetical protein IAI18_16870 [Acetobacteraceae bacterium H6797]|nr:hypothetical protein [Acetobacteraceae bacterium H6797]